MTQQTAQHTPGPWTIDTDSGGRSAEGTFENLNLIIESESVESHIAFVFDDQPANARLIAAAPELLEALQKIAYEPIGRADASDREILNGIEEIARTAIAIAKATGRTE